MLTTKKVVYVTAPDAVPVPTNRLVVGYARSLRDEGSILRQQELLNRFSEHVYGRPLDAFFQDVSAAGSMEREGMRALVQAADEGDIGVVIIEDFDRIARNLGAVLEFQRYCERADIMIHALAVAANHAPVPPLPEVDFGSIRSAIMAERRRLGRARAKEARAARG